MAIRTANVASSWASSLNSSRSSGPRLEISETPPTGKSSCSVIGRGKCTAANSCRAIRETPPSSTSSSSRVIKSPDPAPPSQIDRGRLDDLIEPRSFPQPQCLGIDPL